MTVPAGYERIGDVIVRSEARGWLEDLGLTSLDGAFAAPAEARTSPHKALARLDALGGGRVFVKRWDYNRPTTWLRAAVKLNFPVYSGPIELNNLLALSAAGLRVPVPLAAGERDQGARRQSFVALAQLDGSPLDALPTPAQTAGRRARVRAVADLARSLHGAGFWHKDLYACNLFLDEAAGLGLLDCERVDRREGGPPMRWRVKDLAALAYSADWPTRTERLRFLLRYLDATSLDAASKRLARAITRKARRIARQGAKL